MSNPVSKAQVLERIRLHVGAELSSFGMSADQMRQVIAGERPAPDWLLEAVGIKRLSAHPTTNPVRPA